MTTAADRLKDRIADWIDNEEDPLVAEKAIMDLWDEWEWFADRCQERVREAKAFQHPTLTAKERN